MNTLSPKDLEKRENNLNKLQSSPIHITNLLAVLWVEDDDTELFLDAWILALQWWNLLEEEYQTLKHYLADIDFIERFSYFSKQSKALLQQEGYSDEDILNMWIDLEAEINASLVRFRVYDIVSEGGSLSKYFISVIHSEKWGTVLLLKDTDITYLLQWEAMCNCIDCITTWNWKIKYLLYETEQWIVVYDYQKSELFFIPWKLYWRWENCDIHWIKTDQWQNERLTVLETRDSVSIKKLVDYSDWEEYTRFHKVHHIDENGSSLISHWWIEHSILQRWKRTQNRGAEANIPDIRRKQYDRLIRIPDMEEVFFCNWRIKEVHVTDFDTFVIYQSEFYNPDARGYTSTMINVYSVNQEGIILEMASEDKYSVISDHNNFIVLHYTLEWDFYHNFRDNIWCGNVSNLTSFQDGDHTIISYHDKETGEDFYYSTQYTRSQLDINPESWEVSWASITNNYH